MTRAFTAPRPASISAAVVASITPAERAKAAFEAKRAAVCIAAERLTYADDTDEMTDDLVKLIEAVDALMPSDVLADVASDARYEFDAERDARRCVEPPVRRWGAWL